MANDVNKPVSYEELEYVWRAWHDAAGKPIREQYKRFVELNNEAARLNSNLIEISLQITS